MRGFSKMSDDERQQIKQQHSKVYDGYAIGNVPSNMTPLTVYDAAQDKVGITVTNQGEVKQYTNHNVNETAAKYFHYDEIDEPYSFKSKGPMDPFREEYEEVDEDEQGEEGGMPDDAEDEMEEEEEDVLDCCTPLPPLIERGGAFGSRARRAAATPAPSSASTAIPAVTVPPQSQANTTNNAGITPKIVSEITSSNFDTHAINLWEKF
jgi:hypothetical protein